MACLTASEELPASNITGALTLNPYSSQRMILHMSSLYTFSMPIIQGYRFVDLPDRDALRQPLRDACTARGLKVSVPVENIEPIY
jgi:hypothetical protein